MALKVGIPKALLYYDYYPAWKCFFEELGVEVVLSKDSCKEVIDNGVKYAVNEACLPVKAFYGHVLDLKDRVDLIFIPRMVSIERKAYICPKFLGLSDMIKNGIEDLPPVIDTTIDLRKSPRQILTAACAIGKILHISPLKSLSAFYKASKVLKKYRNILAEGYLPMEAMEKMENSLPREEKKARDLTILFLGHPYNLYDSYLSRSLLEKAQKMGAKVITTELINKKELSKYWEKFNGNMFWTFGRENWGAADYFLSNGGVDGIIYLAAFGCGPDSLFGELIQKRVRRLGKIPFMFLNIDEHTGEAGLLTRLEAFVDMIRWRDGR